MLLRSHPSILSMATHKKLKNWLLWMHFTSVVINTQRYIHTHAHTNTHTHIHTHTHTHTHTHIHTDTHQLPKQKHFQETRLKLATGQYTPGIITVVTTINVKIKTYAFTCLLFALYTNVKLFLY